MGKRLWCTVNGRKQGIKFYVKLYNRKKHDAGTKKPGMYIKTLTALSLVTMLFPPL